MSITPVAAWHDDPYQRYEKRYFDGRSWTSHVSSGGVCYSDPEPIVRSGSAAEPRAGTRASAEARRPMANPGAAPNASATISVALPEEKRRRMAFIAIGCGAAMVVAVLLPWATSDTGSASGHTLALGYITGICGLLFALWGRQGLSPDPVRYKGGALAALIVADVVATMASAALDDLDSLTLGYNHVSPGFGLWLTIIAATAGFWPLVVFWRDFTQRQQAKRARTIAGGS